MSPKTPNILLIVIIVILVGVLGVAVGYIYFGSMNHPNTIMNNTTSNVTNQTNSIPNNTTSVSQTTQQKTQSAQNNSNNGYFNGQYSSIAATAAENIALNWVKNNNDPQGLPVTIDNPNRPGGPVDFEQDGGGAPDDAVYMLGVDVGNQIQFVDVNATNGEVVADNVQNS
ncbi:hypothetical protein [Methanobacterium sp.]|uniref:hypothetical protein n=1 Tax=Methanobacterium sp. TaxID=2164 RepID=UPI003C764E2F